MKCILLRTDYTPWIEDITYIKDIKREQHFIKHLLFRLLMETPCKELRILVYIHANFGERIEKDYIFTDKNSKKYKQAIQTDDWNDIGNVEEFKNFFYNYNIPLI